MDHSLLSGCTLCTKTAFIWMRTKEEEDLQTTGPWRRRQLPAQKRRWTKHSLRKAACVTRAVCAQFARSLLVRKVLSNNHLIRCRRREHGSKQAAICWMGRSDERLIKWTVCVFCAFISGSTKGPKQNGLRVYLILSYFILHCATVHRNMCYLQIHPRQHCCVWFFLSRLYWLSHLGTRTIHTHNGTQQLQPPKHVNAGFSIWVRIKE